MTLWKTIDLKRKYAEVLLFKRDNNIVFMVPWYKGKLVPYEHRILHDIEPDGVIGPHGLNFMDQFEAPFSVEHDWDEATIGSVIVRRCNNCDASFSFSQFFKNVPFQIKLTQASSGISKFCDGQLFYQALLQINVSFDYDDYLIPLNELKMPDYIIEKVDNFVSMLKVMES